MGTLTKGHNRLQNIDLYECFLLYFPTCPPQDALHSLACSWDTLQTKHWTSATYHVQWRLTSIEAQRLFLEGAGGRQRRVWRLDFTAFQFLIFAYVIFLKNSKNQEGHISSCQRRPHGHLVIYRCHVWDPRT